MVLFNEVSSIARVFPNDTLISFGGGQGKPALALFLGTVARHIVAVEKSPFRWALGREALRHIATQLRQPTALGPAF